MIFNKKIHDFNKFIAKWSPDKEYILFGASKECVQFIRSMDHLLGSGVLKISYIVDHLNDTKTFKSNLNEISSFYHESKTLKSNRKEIKIIHIDEYVPSGESVIITTDEYRGFYENHLNDLKIDFTWYKQIASIWPFLLSNIVHIFQTDVLVTERCNLNCSFCNMFIPHYQLPKHRDLNVIYADIDLFFKRVDYVSIFHLVGGEPFLHPEIKSIIQYINDNYSFKIDKFIITTNGSILPKAEVLDILSNSNIILSVSNYSDKLEKLKSKVNRVLSAYKEKNINHYVRNNIKWYDFGDLRIKHNKSHKDLISHFDSCTAPFRGLNEGKFYYCHLNTSAVLTKEFELNENDYVNLADISAEDLIKFDLGFIPLGYLTFCDNCNGCNTGVDIPVSYKEQGLRQ
jgi:organic radical activating enzyme